MSPASVLLSGLRRLRQGSLTHESAENVRSHVDGPAPAEQTAPGIGHESPASGSDRSRTPKGENPRARTRSNRHELVPDSAHRDDALGVGDVALDLATKV